MSSFLFSFLFSDATAVLVTKAESGSLQVGGYSTFYEVEIPCAGGDVELLRHSDHGRAHGYGEIVARAVNLPVVDR